MADIALPSSLKPSSARWWVENQTRGGGQAWDGSEQVVASLAHRLRFRGAFHVWTIQQVRDVQAFFTALDGRANVILMPAFVGLYQSWPVDAQGRTVTPNFAKRYQAHLEGTAYEQPEIPAASAITATVNATAAIRATQMAINVSQGGAPKAGQMFGIGQRAHLISEIVSTVGSVTTVKFRPPLRAQATATTPVLFTRPICRMRLMSDDQGPQEFQSLRFADFTLDLREDY